MSPLVLKGGLNTGPLVFNVRRVWGSYKLTPNAAEYEACLFRYRHQHTRLSGDVTILAGRIAARRRFICFIRPVAHGPDFP